MITFKQFLLESSTERFTKDQIVDLLIDQQGSTMVNKSFDMMVQDIIDNEQYYSKLFHSPVFKGEGYRIMDLGRMLNNDYVNDIRQILTKLQEFDMKNKGMFYSWSKNKKEVFLGLKSNLWTDYSVLSRSCFATVAIQGDIVGIDVNNILQEDSAVKEEQEVLAPKNVPISIVGFTLLPAGKNKSETQFFPVEQFKEFKQQYNAYIKIRREN